MALLGSTTWNLSLTFVKELLNILSLASLSLDAFLKIFNSSFDFDNIFGTFLFIAKAFGFKDTLKLIVILLLFCNSNTFQLALSKLIIINLLLNMFNVILFVFAHITLAFFELLDFYFLLLVKY